MQLPAIADRSDRLARYTAALLGFSIPISTALDGVLTALLAVLWVAGGDLRRKIAIVAANPVALSALILFGMLVAGLTYGTRYPGNGLTYLLKYLDLLFIPIFITMFGDARTRELALRWFCVAMILSFVVAELAAAGFLEGNPLLARKAGHAFRRSITYGLLSAFAAFVFALLAHRETRWPQRLLFAILALVAVKNVLLISIGRTGYLVLIVLSLYLFFVLFGKRGLLVAGLLMVATFAAVYSGSQGFRERVDTVFVDSLESRPGSASRESVTLRLEWYRQSVELIRESPLLGTGTGSFPRVYAEAVMERKSPSLTNPHNEYLLIAVQTGLAGLLLLLHLFWQQLRLSTHLATPLESHLARGLILWMATGCLFNSLLLDHTEGLFFAWLTGVLFAGLKSPGNPATGNRNTS